MNGRFNFPPRLGKHILAASHERGFARVAPEQLAANPQIILQPWGRISGTLVAEGKPVANELMAVAFEGILGINQPMIYLQHHTTTDALGRFDFDHVPPGNLQIIILVPLNTGEAQGWRHNPQRTVTVKPGETVTLKVEKKSSN